jgi:addiction module HigA family antidote
MREPIVHPGEILLEEFLKPMGLTPYALAKACHVPRTRTERLVNEETPVTADTALRLGRYFGIEPEFWLRLQARYDLNLTSKKADINKIKPAELHMVNRGKKLMKKKFPKFKTDAEAEEFVAKADLSEYSFSDMIPMRFKKRKRNPQFIDDENPELAEGQILEAKPARKVLPKKLYTALVEKNKKERSVNKQKTKTPANKKYVNNDYEDQIWGDKEFAQAKPAREVLPKKLYNALVKNQKRRRKL